MDALIVREPWIDLILSGRKTWELRSRATRKIGLIGLIRKGSGQVCGAVELVGTAPRLTRKQLAATEQFHCVPADRWDEVAAAGWLVPWVLRQARPLDCRVPYSHPIGAVTWVRLEPDVVDAVAKLLNH